ncbi:MAG: efflux RND transporter periplasmic adaptor subunit [Bacteroidia bacterium]
MSKTPGKKKKRTGLIWASVIGGVLIILFVVILLGGGKKDNEVTVETVGKHNVVASVSETGRIEPVLEVKIAADVSGEVVELHIAEGQEVHQGEVLVSIRPDNYQSAMEQAQAALNGSVATELQAEAALQQSRTQVIQDSANFQRQDQLFRDKVISKTEWETAQLKLNIARSQLRANEASLKAAKFGTESRRASLKTAQSDLRKTTITASMDGTITRQNIRFGERVVGTMQMQGTELFRIADLSRMQVVVNINENDIVHVHIGDSARVEVDAFEGQAFRGKVTEIAYSAANSLTTTDQITSFEVKVEIDSTSYVHNPDLMRGLKPHQSPFLPGMSAQVEIYTEREDNVVAVPIQAVTVRRLGADDDAEPSEVVFVLRDQQFASLRQVTTGISDSKYIVIKGGLKEGETILTGPYRLLSKEIADSMKVRISKGEIKE